MKFASRWPFSAVLENIFCEIAFNVLLFNKWYDERKCKHLFYVYDLFLKKSTRNILFVLLPGICLKIKSVCLKSKYLQYNYTGKSY